MKHDDRAMLGFLPDALAVQETPPNPIAGVLLFTLLTLFVGTVAWASFGKVDIVATAEGKIIPSAGLKKIQPFAKSMVQEIYVSEGDRVEQGQALIRFDATEAHGEISKLRTQLRTTRIDRAIDVALLASDSARDSTGNSANSTASAPLLLPDGISQSEQALAQQRAANTLTAYYSQLSGIARSLERIEAQQRGAQSQIARAVRLLPNAETQQLRMTRLASGGLVSQVERESAESRVIELKQERSAQYHARNALQAEARALREQIHTQRAQWRSERYERIARADQSIPTLRASIEQWQHRLDHQVLYAPVAGRVQDIQTHTIGGIVTDAQVLMHIVPADAALTAEVFITNNDIGFIDPSMQAEVKIHTFNFTKYGVLDASITHIADDAIVDEQRGLLFKTQLTLQQNSMQIGENVVALKPGMSITAEIKTGKRRIIEFFMAPLLRYREESIRER